jgi:hypothetical protein
MENTKFVSVQTFNISGITLGALANKCDDLMAKYGATAIVDVERDSLSESEVLRVFVLKDKSDFDVLKEKNSWQHVINSGIYND